MNPRQRYLETVLFGNPDKVPLSPGSGRLSTREAWHKQGLPKSVEPSDIPEYAYRQAGGTDPWPHGGPGFPVNERMIPIFEEKIIEEKERTRVVQDWKGNICEISNEFDTNYLRNAIDFVTRRWIKCPVESWEDWEAMKERYDADTPERLPENAEELRPILAERDYPIRLHFSGPFWQMREWLGFEGLCVAFYDDPELVHDMVQFWTAHVARLLERSFAYFTPDEVHLSEDMAYKRFSMVSPEMARTYLMPAWRTWGEIVRDAEVPIYAMDSDGYIGELIPLWIEAGMNCCDPIEVAAGNDLVAFREEFGKKMAYKGGVDKRAMAAGGQTLIDEIERITPVIRGGGYLPSCDHGIPSDVSWPNYVKYIQLLARKTGWL